MTKYLNCRDEGLMSTPLTLPRGWASSVHTLNPERFVVKQRTLSASRYLRP
jgi:hypothetical protein